MALEFVEYLRGATSAGGNSVMARAQLIIEQSKAFIKNPILGIGFGNTDIYVHNIYLEALFETGIIGALLFMGIVYKGMEQCFRIWRERRDSSDYTGFVSPVIMFSWLFCIVGGVFSSIFDNLQLWFWTGAILNLSIRREEN